jgi:hypothetical protein
MQLTSTVFHVWGKLNRTFDRSAQGENLLDYFDQYVKWTDPSKPNFLQVGELGWICVALWLMGSSDLWLWLWLWLWLSACWRAGGTPEGKPQAVKHMCYAAAAILQPPQRH